SAAFASPLRLAFALKRVRTFGSPSTESPSCHRPAVFSASRRSLRVHTLRSPVNPAEILRLLCKVMAVGARAARSLVLGQSLQFVDGQMAHVVGDRPRAGRGDFPEPGEQVARPQ